MIIFTGISYPISLIKSLVFIVLFLSPSVCGYCAEQKYFSCTNEARSFPKTNKGTVCAINMPEWVGYSIWYPSDVLQDFIVECDTITAVSLQVYNTSGWTKYEILESSGDLPGEVLSSAWIKIDNYCGVGHGGLLTVIAGDIPVKRGARYYIRGARRHNIFAVGASNGDSYKDGRARGENAADGADLNFVVSVEPRAAPYLREVKVSTACRDWLEQGASTDTSREQWDEEEICAGYQYLTDEKIVPDSETDAMILKLFSPVWDVRTSATGRFRHMSIQDSVRLAVAVFEYVEDADPFVRAHAREAMAGLGAELGSAPLELVKYVRTGPPDRLKIFMYLRLTGSEVAAVTEKILNKTKSKEAEVVLKWLGNPDKILSKYYYSGMTAVASRFSANDIAFNDWEQLPEGCVLREFLPASLTDKIRHEEGNGVKFEIRKSRHGCLKPADKCKWLDEKLMSWAFKREIRFDGDYFVSMEGCRVPEELAVDIRALAGFAKEKRSYEWKFWK